MDPEFGISFNLFSLLALKYSNFYLPALQSLLRRLSILPDSAAFQLFLPIGLSFITLQMISYLVDVHNRLIQPEKG